MAQTGYTPIYLYYSGTATHIPLAANLGNGELAINAADGNLFYKNTSNAVVTIPVLQSSSTQSGWLSSTDWNTFNNKAPAGSYLTSVTADSPLTGFGTSASHLSIPAANGSTNGYLSSTDWTTFNSKQPAGTYVTSVSGTAPVVSSGGTTPAISMAAATSSANGYLTSTDWSTFNGKQAALVSGTNIKTVNGTTLLGSGDLGTIGIGYGGTGQTSFGSGQIHYGSFSTTSTFVWNGSQLGIGTASPGCVVDILAASNTSLAATLRVNSNNAAVNTIVAYDGVVGSGQMTVKAGASSALILGANNTETARLFSSGGVSIGNTTDPGATNLSVTGRISVGTTSALTGLDVYYAPDANWGTANLFDPTSAAANTGGVLALSGYKTTTSSKAIFAKVVGAKENATAGNEAGYLAFYTNNNSAYNEGMRVNSSGGVSIGNTTDPGVTNLSVSGTIKVIGTVAAFTDAAYKTATTTQTFNYALPNNSIHLFTALLQQDTNVSVGQGTYLITRVGTSTTVTTIVANANLSSVTVDGSYKVNATLSASYNAIIYGSILRLV